MGKHRPAVRSRPIAAVVAFGALLLLPGLGRMGALESTDARYLAIAHEMWITGDWLVPRLGGAPHLDKPPLVYWAGSAGFALVGPDAGGGRLVEQAFVLATALLVLGFARRFVAPSWSLVAALVFLTTALPYVTSRGLATDLFQLAFVTGALGCLFAGARTGRAGPVIAAGALLGGSMLAKGPIGLLVVAAVWGAFAAAVRGRARLSGPGVVLGLALFAGIGLPWYALLVSRQPALLDWFLGYQLASRLTASGAGHVKGATFLLRTWVLGLLPWTPVVGLALARLWPRGRLRDAEPLDVFLVAWAIVPVVLFSLFPTKLATYILPAFPGAALAVARAGSGRLLDDRAGRAALVASWLLIALAAATVALLLLLEGTLGVAWLARFDAAKLRAPALVCTALGGLAALALVGARRAGRTRSPAAAARTCTAIGAVAGATFVIAFAGVAPALPTLRDTAALVRAVPGARAISFAFKPGLFFYLEPEHPVWVATVQGLLAPWVDPASVPRLTLRRAEAVAMLGGGAPTFALIARGPRADALAAETGARPVRDEGKYVLLANPPALHALGIQEDAAR
jgi:4-amino-4-deoxy-L-arabinose transferase-like glycosyltransferase